MSFEVLANAVNAFKGEPAWCGSRPEPALKHRRRVTRFPAVAGGGCAVTNTPAAIHLFSDSARGDTLGAGVTVSRTSIMPAVDEGLATADIEHDIQRRVGQVGDVDQLRRGPGQ